MDRQTLRDWVHRFNASGPQGLIDNWTEGPKPRLSEQQLAQFAQIVEAGPDREKDGVVRWRRIDLKWVIAERFGVAFHERYVGKLLKKLGFSHISARPRHPAQDERIVEGFKKTSRARLEGPSRRAAGDDAGRDLVCARGPDRPEEWAGSAVGQARNTATAARRSALRQRLSVRRDLPSAGRRRRPRASLCRRRHDAASPRRNLTQCRRRRPCRSHPRQSRMAHHGQARRARQHHADLPALARPGAQPGRQRLAVSAPELALKHRVRKLRRHH